MKSCNKLSQHLLKLIYITLFPVLKAQKVEVSPEVTGYVNSDVTLHCALTQGPQLCNITQVQWDFLQPDANKTAIFVYNSQHGENCVAHLKKRLELKEQSLIIKHVQMADAGSYICTLSTFPCGPYDGTTKLLVHEMKPSSAGIVVAIVTAVLLPLAIMAAVIYLIYIRRRKAAVRHQVLIDTSGPVAPTTRPSFIVKEKEVVYSDIRPKKPEDATRSSKKHRAPEQADDVTYAEVVVLHQKPK